VFAHCVEPRLSLHCTARARSPARYRACSLDRHDRRRLIFKAIWR
jgi:hypothetical protein